MNEIEIPIFYKRTKEDWMAEIEEIIEKGESCVTFICNQIALSRRSVEKYMLEMRQEGILQRSRRMKIGDSLEWMHIIAQERPVQKPLFYEPPTRDWLVAEFFGDYKP